MTTPDLSYLRYAPLSPESFSIAWAKYYGYADRTKLVENTVYLSNVMLRAELVRDATDLHSEGIGARIERDFKGYELFFASLTKRANVINSYSGNLLIQYALPIIKSPSASADSLLKIMEFVKVPGPALSAAANKNAPIEESAYWIVRKWSREYTRDTLASAAWNPTDKAIVEAKCDSFLAKHGWDEETLKATNIEIKLKAIVEAKCDAFLLKYGWDKDTLAVTDIQMKLKVMNS